jgi:hypothetical protein
MSTASMRSGRSRARPTAGASSGGAGRWAAIVAGLAVALVLIAWLLGWLRFGTDPRVQEILAMQEDARQKYAATGGPRTVAEATEAFTAMTEIRGKIEALPEHLRPEVERSGGNVFRSAFRARIDEYLNAPPAQRTAVLDRQIDQEEMMRKAFEAGRAAMNAVGAGGAASGAGGNAEPPRGGPPRSGTQEDGNRWRKGMIDRTTPEQRARYVEYRRAIDKRREERGLPSGWSR